MIRRARLDGTAVLQRWDEKPHVRAATSNEGTIAFDADREEELAPRADGTELFIAELGARPIGAPQIIDPATERSGAWGAVDEDLRAIDTWIGEESCPGRGSGTQSGAATGRAVQLVPSYLGAFSAKVRS